MTEQVQAHILRRYNLLKKIGSGAYGHVWKVTDKKTTKVLALKKIFDAFQHSTDAQRTFRQITLLKQIDHPNIIKLHHVIRAQNDKDLYLIFQYMEADLHNAIGQKILKDAHNRFIFYQLAKGIKYLHSAQIIHRDLKPSNLLLNSDCTMNICDFGLARSLVSDKFNQQMILTQEVATRWYRAPEVLLGSHTYGKSADIWSMGCILGQILTGKPLFPGSSTLNQLQKIISFIGKPTKSDIDCLNAQSAQTMIDQVSQTRQKPLIQWFKAGTPQQAIDLVVKMLNINPKKRPSISDVLRSSYLAGFSNPKEELESNKIIKPPVSDNTRLGLMDYRYLIYEHIKKVYQKQSASQINLQNIDNLCKIQRPHTAQRVYQHKKNEYHGYRNSSNISKNQKPKNSENSASYHSSTGKPTVSTSNSYYEEQYRIKKKSSLKDMLKNKRPLIGYKLVPEGRSNIVKKVMKNYEIYPATKQNYPVFVKFT